MQEKSQAATYTILSSLNRRIVYLRPPRRRSSNLDKQSLFSWYMTVVYGLHTVEHRRSLWATLAHLAQGLGEVPWVILGDFNAVLWPHGRENGNNVEGHILHGPIKKGEGSNRMSSKLDRVLAHSVWFELCSDAEAEVFPPGISVNTASVGELAVQKRWWWETF